MAQTVNIAQAAIASGAVADIKIEEIVLGGVTIGQLTLEGTTLDIAAASAALQAVRIVINLDFAFDWWINLGFWSDSGTASLGSLSFALDLGNVSIPSLGNIPLSVPNIAIANLSAVVAPIAAADLGGGTFSALSATNIVVPKNGFTLTGFAVGGVTIANVEVPEAAAAAVSIQDFHPNGNLVLPNASLGPLQIPSVTTADVETTAAIGFNGNATQQGLGLNLGVLGGTFDVTPTAYVSIGSLQLQGVSLSGSVAKAILDNIGVPVDIGGINLSTIDIGQITAANITL
ncbi:MAG TPA: hypothetical protein VMD55_07040 [Terracidiphilus sp.]|nr:hypothetical protein [Terracidiphilus sp.]